MEIMFAEEAAMLVAEPVGLTAREVGQQGPDIIVGALAHLIVKLPEAEIMARGVEGLGPGEDVEVIAVDERAVDVE
ncbi:hypothetical protein GCM10022280_20020 [Sphingomonas swuensis]|uniref:Uncharacterized protein n=1 Tax=Sphingomonas swuensis TaxID=977800 RepID=A0ABP7T2J3_9SPHN